MDSLPKSLPVRFAAHPINKRSGKLNLLKCLFIPWGHGMAKRIVNTEAFPFHKLLKYRKALCKSKMENRTTPSSGISSSIRRPTDERSLKFFLDSRKPRKTSQSFRGFIFSKSDDITSNLDEFESSIPARLMKQINHGQAWEELWDLNRFLLQQSEGIEVLMRFAHLVGKLRKCP